MHCCSSNATATSVEKEKEHDDCVASFQNDKSNGKNKNDNSPSTLITAKTETNAKSAKLPAKETLWWCHCCEIKNLVLWQC